MLPFARIGDIAAHTWVIMDEHAAYAESHIMVDTPDDHAPSLHSPQGGCLEWRRRFLLPKSQSSIRAASYVLHGQNGIDEGSIFSFERAA